MYADPSLIRKHRVSLYLNDAENKLLEATHEYIGGELAPLLRDLLMKSAHSALIGDVALTASNNEGPQMGLFKG